MHDAAVLVALFLVTGGSPALSGQSPVDGIAAVVDEEIISVGEVRRAVAMARGHAPEILDAACGAPLAQLDPEAAISIETSALECLIDERLIFREVHRFPQFDVPREQVDQLWQQVETLYPDPQARRSELLRYGLTEQALRADLRRQILISAYIDSRFRLTIDISETEARRYYEETLVPDMQARRIEVPSFEAVAEQFVVPILREREVNWRVESWVADLRARAIIERRFP